MTPINRRRLILLAVLILLHVGAIGARLFTLQIVRGEEFRARAHGQHERQITVQATRGSILDRKGRELAISVETQSLFVHPWRVEDPARAAALLAPVIDVAERKLLERLESDKPFVYLRRFLDEETAEAVRALDLPLGDNLAFGFDPEPRRIYPRGKLGVHVVGFATIDGDGVEGIERQFDFELKGDPSVYLALRDARNGRLRQLIRAPEKEPQDVVLTLDMVLQHIVERELDRTMRRTGARAASGILIDPTTGHVLALANRPAADPNHYGSARDRERINRALVHFYEPGSTFKPVPLAAALDRGTVRSDSPIFCENGVYRLGKRRIHDVSPHKTLTPGQILEHSSNIGIVKVALTLGARDLRQSIVDFGFGARTGIELPGESPGLLAPVPRWSDFTHASLAFGQEIGVTALQMTSAIAAIANDGVLQPPRVVLGARDANGEFERFAPAEGQRVLAEGTAQQLQSFLRGVVERGTGTRAKIPGYRLAGKSGTAQKAIPGGYSETEYFASFVGFGPADTPRLAGLVLLDSPRGDRHQGGQVAAPAFGRIMQDALRYLRAPHDVEPPRPTHVLQAAQRASSGSATKIRTDRPPVRPGFVPDVRGLSLRQAAVTLSANGCRPEVNGRGRVTSQRPSAGARLPEDGICFVGLQDERGRAVSPPAGRARL